MAKKKGMGGRIQGMDEKAFVAALEKVAETLQSGQVPKSAWKGMKELQRLGERSLESNVCMSGPIKSK